MKVTRLGSSERLQLAALDHDIQRAKEELDRANHGALYVRSLSERAAEKVRRLRAARIALEQSFSARA